MTDIVTKAVDDPAAWRGEDLGARDDWILRLNRAQIAELESATDHALQRHLDLFAIERSDFPLPTLGPVLAALADPVDNGRGFVVLKGVPVAGVPEDRARITLWGIGRHVGVAEGQDGEGNLLHSVRDIGKAVRGTDNIRAYQTDAPIPFHNDGCDAFLLLCHRQAKSGGGSILCSAVQAFNEIAAERPDLARVLQQDFHFDARGQRLDGAKVQTLPIFQFHQNRFFVLHKEGYIRTAQRFAEIPKLTDLQRQALRLLREVTDRPGMALTFDMQPGDLVIANNHTLLHGRTDFEDYDDEDLKRHMLRLWVTLPSARALPPSYAGTREFGRTYARRMPGARPYENVG